MNQDKVADIPVRHRFVNYVCTIGYSNHYDSFTLIRARYADSNRTGTPKNSYQLYLRILNEPILRASLLEALVPDAKTQITDLREKAISDRGSRLGLIVGIISLVLAGYFLHKSTLWLGKHFGYDWAQIITYIPMSLAFLIFFPVQNIVEQWHAQRHCNAHGHRLETFKNTIGAEITHCKRCGFNFTASNNT